MFTFTAILSKIISILGELTPIQANKILYPNPKKSSIQKFQVDIRKLPPIKNKSSIALKDWNANRKLLRKNILSNDVTKFLTWKVIKDTMFYEPNILEYFSLLTEWKKWKDTIIETGIGNPKRYLLNRSTSGNSIHLAYHLQQLERAGISLIEFKQIVEFGGGYGKMCELVFKGSFNGKYIIFDLPEFNLLQRFYLSSVGLERKIFYMYLMIHYYGKIFSRSRLY